MKKRKENEIGFTIIAGSLKGRRIVAPDLGVTRPPLTRLRKSIFDFLRPHLDEAAYLDLFSGTGSYLFEAVSRGVASATGVELEAELANSINRQASKFEVSDRLECLCSDVFEQVPKLSKAGKRFDIIMMAPPQYAKLIDRALKTMAQYPLSTPEGLILCQADTSEKIVFDTKAYDLVQARKYGNTTYTILSPAR